MTKDFSSNSSTFGIIKIHVQDHATRTGPSAKTIDSWPLGIDYGLLNQ
jgi:hypothetical protein